MVDDYFADIVQFLSTRVAPPEFTVAQKKQLVVKATDYQLIAGNLYKLGTDGILRRCVLEHERHMILSEAHEGVVGGHYAGKVTTQNILCVQDYGGPPFIKMLRSYVRPVMSVRESGSLPGEMKCL
jgi:hypothetical protein